eukprot:765324-Hanusia_phi.AAC.2
MADGENSSGYLGVYNINNERRRHKRILQRGRVTNVDCDEDVDDDAELSAGAGWRNECCSVYVLRDHLQMDEEE